MLSMFLIDTLRINEVLCSSQHFEIHEALRSLCLHHVQLQRFDTRVLEMHEWCMRGCNKTRSSTTSGDELNPNLLHNRRNKKARKSSCQLCFSIPSVFKLLLKRKAISISSLAAFSAIFFQTLFLQCRINKCLPEGTGTCLSPREQLAQKTF